MTSLFRAHMSTDAAAHTATHFTAQLLCGKSGPSPTASGHAYLAAKNWSTSGSLHGGGSFSGGKPSQQRWQSSALGHKLLREKVKVGWAVRHISPVTHYSNSLRYVQRGSTILPKGRHGKPWNACLAYETHICARRAPTQVRLIVHSAFPRGHPDAITNSHAYFRLMFFFPRSVHCEHTSICQHVPQ